MFQIQPLHWHGSRCIPLDMWSYLLYALTFVNMSFTFAASVIGRTDVACLPRLYSTLYNIPSTTPHAVWPVFVCQVGLGGC